MMRSLSHGLRHGPGVSTFVEVLPGGQPTVTTPDAQHLPVTTPVGSAPAPSFTAFRTSSESGGELLPVAACGGSKAPLLKRGGAVRHLTDGVVFRRPYKIQP